MHLPLLAQRFFEQPHMVTMSRLVVLERYLVGRLGLPLSIEPEALSLEMDGQEQAPRRLLRSVAGVAVIDIHGTLVQRSGGMDALSGLVSYADIRGELERAIADPAARCIILNLDSPGGEVAGCFELADRIRAATATKPILAYAHDLAASAAYAIAAACTAIYIPETGAAGSIGVVMAHIDQSARDAAEGYKVTHLYSGARKVDGNPHEPLGDEARAELQAHIDQLADVFRAKVAAFRGMPVSAVAATEARVYIGSKAVEAGLADGVLSDEAVLQLAMDGGPMGKPRLEGSDPEGEEAVKAAPPMDDEEEDEEDDMAKVAARFPLAAAALRADGAASERARISALELAASGRPALAGLLQKAKAEGYDLNRFKVEAYDQPQDQGAAYLEARRQESAAANVTAATIREPVPAGVGSLEARAEAQWDRSPDLQDEFPEKSTYVAFVKADNQGLVRISSRASR